VDHLVLIGEVVVEQDSSQQRKHCQTIRRDPSLEANYQQDAPNQLDDHCAVADEGRGW
jgi:hypothetical protein